MDKLSVILKINDFTTPGYKYCVKFNQLETFQPKVHFCFCWVLSLDGDKIKKSASDEIICLKPHPKWFPIKGGCTL